MHAIASEVSREQLERRSRSRDRRDAPRVHVGRRRARAAHGRGARRRARDHAARGGPCGHARHACRASAARARARTRARPGQIDVRGPLARAARRSSADRAADRVLPDEHAGRTTSPSTDASRGDPGDARSASGVQRIGRHQHRTSRPGHDVGKLAAERVLASTVSLRTLELDRRGRMIRVASPSNEL